ncbi:MAG: hypothetical protein Q7K28_01380 [Candidatus Wildermuthbacteria bacterium]|nr:hypothetical protein [Candidatus Wildermuthbacteria bacterium]
MRGYIALISILIINAIILLIAISAGVLSISESNLNLEKNRSSGALYLASACAEEALQKIREFTSFQGSGNLALGEGTCTYAVTKLTGQNRIIAAGGTVQNAIQKIKITLDGVTPDINITSWQEVADF